MAIQDVDDVRKVVRALVGANLDALVPTWYGLTQSQMSLATLGVLTRMVEYVSISPGLLVNYVPATRIVQIDDIYLVDNTGKRDVAFLLEKRTLSSLWQMMHGVHLNADTRKPEYWAPSGVGLQLFSTQLAEGCKPSWMIFPQPFSGLYSTFLMEVHGYGIEAEVATGASKREFSELARRTLQEGVLRFAYLYVQDLTEYQISSREFREGIKQIRGMFGAIAAHRK